jgi:phosphotriesterase-related protein
MRTSFIILSMFLLLAGCSRREKAGIIMTVKGPVPADQMGITLTHEHILVDFIGADSVSGERYVRKDVINKVLPYLRKVKELGCVTFVECTSLYMGRDPLILKSLSDSTGLNILTNTGLYGAYDNKYIPVSLFNESPDKLAEKWIGEWENGIDGTGIKPGFIKISVNGDSLSGFHKKLITAAARTHLKSGLTIASHTVTALPAFQQLEILQQEGVSPEAFIWVHAINEKDTSKIIAAGKMGAWISLDNLNDNNPDQFLVLIKMLRRNDLFDKILLSHDAGWYDPAKANGGDFRGYTTLFEKLIPALKQNGFSEDEIRQLLVINPAKAYRIGVKRKGSGNTVVQE